MPTRSPQRFVSCCFTVLLCALLPPAIPAEVAAEVSAQVSVEPPAGTTATLSRLDQQLQSLLGEIRRTTEEGQQAPIEASTVPARQARWQDASATLEAQLTALESALRQDEKAARSWQRKIHALRGQLSNLRRALDLARTGQTELLRQLPTAPAPDPRWTDKAAGADSCDAAIPVTLGQTVQGTLTNATADGYNSCGGIGPTPDVWISFTAQESGYVGFDSSGSSFDTTLSVHSDCPGNLDTELSCSDDGLGLQAVTFVWLRAGERVQIRLSSFDADGSLEGTDGTYVLRVGTVPTVRGRVAREPEDLPLNDILVYLCSADSGFLVSGDRTNSNGIYLLGGDSFGEQPDPGTYYVHTAQSQSLGYVDEVYEDIPRPSQLYEACNEPAGTPVDLQLGDHLNDIDLALSTGGTIRGQVRRSLDSEGSGKPLSAQITVFNEQGREVASTSTGLGLTPFILGPSFYEIPALPDGEYFVRAVPENGVSPVVFDGRPCPSPCSATTGTPVRVIGGQVTEGINFEFDGGPILHGTVTDTDGWPLADVQIVVYLANLRDLDTPRRQQTAIDGSYAFYDLPPFAYFVETRSSYYIDEIYRDVACSFSCDRTRATVVDLQRSSEAVVDFDLEAPDLGAGPSIVDGRLLDAETQQPLQGVSVYAYDSELDLFDLDSTDTDGAYRLRLIANQVYYLFTAAKDTHENQFFTGEPCGPGQDDPVHPSPSVCDPRDVEPVVAPEGAFSAPDIHLRPYPRLRGQVTDAAGTPLPDVTVTVCKFADVERCNEHFHPFAHTGVDGTYSAPVPAGQYYVLFSGPIHQQMYGAAPCTGYDDEPCSTTGAQRVKVGNSDVSGLDIQARARGCLRGLVRDTRGEPVADGHVRLWSVQEQRVLTSRELDREGAFRFANLLADPAEYILVTDTEGWIDELHDGTPCEGACPSTVDAPLTFDGLADDCARIDFELQPLASLSGSVFDVETGEAIESARIYLLDADDPGNLLSEFSNRHGFYRFEGLSAGTYYLVADTRGYPAQLYPDIECSEVCPDPAEFEDTAITVSAGEQKQELDFQLSPRGGITGRVREALTGRNLSSFIQIFDATGERVDYTFASLQDGHFRSRILPPGNYYVAAADDNDPWIAQLFGGPTCPAGPGEFPCEDITALATPVTITEGVTTTGIDFELEPRATGLRGLVYAAYSNDRLAGVRIDAWNTFTGAAAGHTLTDEDGEFRFELPVGTYFVSTHNQLGYGDQVFDGVRCAAGSALQNRCDPRRGTPVEVRSAIFPNLRFRLDSRQAFLPADAQPSAGVEPMEATKADASVEGTVRGPEGQVLQGIEIVRRHLDGTVLDVTLSDERGAYRFSGLEAGIYLFEARSRPSDVPYLAQTFDDIDCQPTCDGALDFERRGGTPVPVRDGAQVRFVAFHLAAAGRIQGRIFDGTQGRLTSGRPISGAEVTYVSQDGSLTGTLTAQPDGTYTTPALPLGLYYLTARAGRYENQLFDQLPCPLDADGQPDAQPSCNLFDGTPVRVRAAGTSRHIDFPLRPLGRIHGRVFDAASGQPLSRQYLRLLRSDGEETAVFSRQGGHFDFPALATGTYFLGSDLAGPYGTDASDFANVLYRGLSCREPCDLYKGTPISVEAGNEIAIDLHLPLVPLRIAGRVHNAASGAPLAGVEIAIYDLDGTLVDSTLSKGDGHYRVDLQPGEYKVVTTNGLGFVDQVYPGVDCDGACDPSVATPVPLDFETGQRVDFALRSVLAP